MSFDNEYNSKVQCEVMANMADHVHSLNKSQLLQHCVTVNKVRPSLFIWKTFVLAMNKKNMG